MELHLSLDHRIRLVLKAVRLRRVLTCGQHRTVAEVPSIALSALGEAAESHIAGGTEARLGERQILNIGLEQFGDNELVLRCFADTTRSVTNRETDHIRTLACKSVEMGVMQWICLFTRDIPIFSQPCGDARIFYAHADGVALVDHLRDKRWTDARQEGEVAFESSRLRAVLVARDKFHEVRFGELALILKLLGNGSALEFRTVREDPLVRLCPRGRKLRRGWGTQIVVLAQGAGCTTVERVLQIPVSLDLRIHCNLRLHGAFATKLRLCLEAYREGLGLGGRVVTKLQIVNQGVL